MRKLALALDDTGFEQLVETARSLIPTLAPEWTDHNIHDPGIMLLELLSWIAEAQIYSLSRLRRDERRAYSQLLGLKARGPVPATGSIWPAGHGPKVPWPPGTVIGPEKKIWPNTPNAPVFRVQTPTRFDAAGEKIESSVLLTEAKVVSVVSRFGKSGRRRDWTRSNEEPGATFLPFSDPPEANDRLILALDRAPVARASEKGAAIAIGFEIESSTSIVGEVPTASSIGELTRRTNHPQRLRVVAQSKATANSDEVETAAVAVVADSTEGLLHSGVLLLDAGDLSTMIGPTTLFITAAGGALVRSPRVKRVGLNVIAVEQIEMVFDEEVPYFGRGAPNQQYLVERAVAPDSAEGQLKVVTLEPGGPKQWELVSDLDPWGGTERKFTFDRDTGTIAFGNGVNGAIPTPGAVLQLTYPACAGASGNLPKELDWNVSGIAGVFGTNSKAFTGGSNRETLNDLRRRARFEFRNLRPIITTADLEAAALAEAELGVARAAEIPPDQLPGWQLRGSRVLVVAGFHGDSGGIESENAEWLEEIRSRLAFRLSLGQRLAVISARYFPLRVEARIEAVARADPAAVAREAEKRLLSALAIFPEQRGDKVWHFGRDVSALAVQGWLKGVEGVARVTSVRLRSDGGRDGNGGGGASGQPAMVQLGASELPWLQIAPGDISVERPSRGAGR